MVTHTFNSPVAQHLAHNKHWKTSLFPLKPQSFDSWPQGPHLVFITLNMGSDKMPTGQTGQEDMLSDNRFYKLEISNDGLRPEV